MFLVNPVYAVQEGGAGNDNDSIFSGAIVGDNWDVDLSGNLTSLGTAIIGLKTPGLPINLNVQTATTTDTGDSIKVECGNESCSATNYGFIWMRSATSGDLTKFTITADVTILNTGATFGKDGQGDITGALLKVFLVNDNGTLRTCTGYQGGRTVVVTTDTTATPASANTPESLLCDTAVGSATNTIYEIGYTRSDFTDTGGASENLWANQTGVDDIVTGPNVSYGVYQPCTTTYTGFSSDPPTTNCQWTQDGNIAHMILETGNGTSDAATFYFTLPTKAADQAPVPAMFTDNSSPNVDWGRIAFNADNTLVACGLEANADDGFTAANNKATLANFHYRVQQ